MRHLMKSLNYCCSGQGKAQGLLQKALFAELKNRQLLMLTGKDVRTFLQGIMTNNINLLYQDNTETIANKKIALYTLFLNPKGKVVTDGIIFRPVIYSNGKAKLVQNQLWIDVSEPTSSILGQHLAKYTWKKDITINQIDSKEQGPRIHAGFIPVFGDQKLQKLSPEAKKAKNLAGTIIDFKDNDPQQDGVYANIGFYDPRHKKLGARIICDNSGFNYRGQNKKVSQQQYDKMCLLNGVTPSISMRNKLPFMFNSDLFNGFSFTKGCYLGQQLVARAYHTGIVRRRVFPYALTNNKIKLQEGTVLYDQKKNQLGKVFQSQEGFGTVLSSYLPLLQLTWPIRIAQHEGVIFCPFSQQLTDYINKMKQKQARLQQIDL